MQTADCSSFTWSAPQWSSRRSVSEALFSRGRFGEALALSLLRNENASVACTSQEVQVSKEQVLHETGPRCCAGAAK